MRPILSKLCASALAVSVALGSGVAVTNAAPLSLQRSAQQAPESTMIHQVQLLDEEMSTRGMSSRRWEQNLQNRYRESRRWDRDRDWDRWDRDRDHDWGRDWHDWDDDDYVRYYHGHRGYRYARPGYRYYDGWWFPAAAFVAGALVGGAITSDPGIRYKPRSDAHISWCYDRYRSYRVSDNTFQPYHGPRKPCISPYS